jgi:hypothetical protein
MKVMVTGGRKYADEDRVLATFKAFIQTHGQIDELVVGDATGADSLARVIAMELGIKVSVFYANWKLHKMAAGPIRNQELIDQDPDWLLPFPGGNGTADATRRAVKKGIPIFKL